MVSGMSKHVLHLSHIRKTFHQGESNLHILNDVALDVNEGEIVAIVGPSGCGKSTLMHIAGLLDSPDRGTISIGGVSCTKANEKKRTQIRRDYLGFVYQYHHLMPEFTALENVALPQIIAGKKKKDAKIFASQLLGQFGLGSRSAHYPSQLSGGEQQRVAIARALANQPKLLLADEPTGNLDPHTADEVFSVMIDQVRKRKLAVLIVTHNPDLALKADRVVTLKDGILK